jgi:hypothetical protein
MFMNQDSFASDHGSFGDRPIPYITSGGAWSESKSVLREKLTAQGEKNTPQELMILLCKKLYDVNQKALKTSAFCKVFHTFMLCVKSLFAGFDMRGFFGGMSKYHDTRALLQSLNLPFANKFDDNFLDSGSVDVDPFATVGRLDHDIYCICVRIWDLLLFFAIMKRPRRDVSLIEVRTVLTDRFV